MQVDVGVIHSVLGRLARADFQQDGVPRRAVLQMMPVRHPGLEARAVAGAENLLAGAGRQHDLALQHVHEFILGRMPVPLAGPRAGRQTQQIHAKIGEPGHIAQSSADASRAGRIERRGVARAQDGGDFVQIDSLRHGLLR